MLRGALVLAAAVALSGCLSASTVQPASLGLLGSLLPAEEPLWFNPQTTPHPAFNFPTLTNPATGASVPSWWQPIAAKALPGTIAGLEHLADTGGEVPSSAGMSVFGSLAVLPGWGAESTIVDIRDPEAPKVLSTIDEPGTRNTDFIAYPDGRLVITFSTGRHGLIPLWDITDPTKPVRLGEVNLTELSGNTHKVNVVPGTPIIYNGNSAGGANPQPGGARTVADGRGFTEIVDASDPLNPVVTVFQNGFGCHHIYFWNNPAEDKYRAICAGIQFTQLWDIADPLNPEVLVSIPVHHGAAGTPSGSIPIMAFSHFSILNAAGNVLIVGDEMGGGGLPPGCAARLGTPLADASTPLGAIWFYDITVETDPKLLGWFSPGTAMLSNAEPGPDALAQSCTAHHGRLVPAEGRELLAMAFYSAGVVLVDFTDPAMPFLVDQWNDHARVWEAQYYNGYVFTGDMQRGMDVLTFR